MNYVDEATLKCLEEVPEVDLYASKVAEHTVAIKIGQWHVKAAPDWVHDSIITRRSSTGVFEVNASKVSLSELFSDPAVFDVYEVPEFHTMNRFTAGVLRGGETQNVLDPDPRLNWAPPRYKWGELTGAGQVVTVVDTGLHHQSPFFVDRSVPFAYNQVIQGHRKLVRYAAYIAQWDN